MSPSNADWISSRHQFLSGDMETSSAIATPTMSAQVASHDGIQWLATKTANPHLWQRNSTMSQLPTPRWSPSAVLDIITASNDISCAGITQKGLPCRWDLGGDPKLQALHLLDSMSQKSPREALDDLPQLARLCLCQKNHQQQAARVVARWTALIEQYDSS